MHLAKFDGLLQSCRFINLRAEKQSEDTSCLGRPHSRSPPEQVSPKRGLAGYRGRGVCVLLTDKLGLPRGRSFWEQASLSHGWLWWFLFMTIFCFSWGSACLFYLRPIWVIYF